MRNKKNSLYYHAMMLPGMILLVIFSIVPMFGIVMAFQKYLPAKGIFGSKFVGMYNFNLLLMYPQAKQVFINTLVIATSKIVLGIVVPVIFAIMMNEVTSLRYKRAVQTVVYLPNFLSWVILAIMFTNIFSYNGMVNRLTGLFGISPKMFMVSNDSFRSIIIWTDVWKTFGYGAIVYLSAITSIDPNLYEAAAIDGCNRWNKIIHVVLPAMTPTIILMTTLSIGNVLNAGFDQVYNMYSPLVYETGDIIDTYVYRMGLQNLQYGFATAVGLLKSVVSFILLSTAYWLAKKLAGYSLF